MKTGSLFDLSSRPQAFWQVLGFSLFVMSFRALLLPDALFLNDEYYYAKTAQAWFLRLGQTGAVTSIPGQGEAGFPNVLFFAIYRFTFVFGDGFYTAAKFLNVFFLALTTLAIRQVGTRFTDTTAAGWIAVLYLWLPSTTYASFFLAEPLYECLVWTGFALFFTLIDRDLRSASAALGVLLSAAFLAKPTASALLIAANAVIVVVAWRCERSGHRWRRVLASLVAINVLFVATGFVLNACVTGHLAWDPVGKFYRTDLSQGLTVQLNRQFVYDNARFLSLYCFVVLMVFGPVFTALAAGSWWAARRAGETALAGLAVLGLLVLLLGSVKAGVNWEHVYAGHPRLYSTRYMSALFPLLLIGFSSWSREAMRETKLRRWVGIPIAVIVVVLAVAWSGTWNEYQVHEIFWTSALPYAYPAAVMAFVAMSAYYALSRQPLERPYFTLLAGWAVLSAMGLFRHDKWETEGFTGASGRAARVVQTIVQPAAYNKGMVISDINRRATAFMFRFPGFIPMRLADAGSLITRESIPAGTQWVVFLGPVRPTFDTRPCVQMASALFCSLSDGSLVRPGKP